MNRPYKRTALLICDLQTKTVANLYYRKHVIDNVNKLLYMKQYSPYIQTCVAAQFIPDKLGTIHDSLDKENIDVVYNKDTYSMLNSDLSRHLEDTQIEDIILTGMETQWCINSTLIDLTNLNYTVYIPVDAIGNNLNKEENTFNIESLRNNKARLITTDGIICQNLVSANDVASKQYIELIKQTRVKREE